MEKYPRYLGVFTRYLDYVARLGTIGIVVLVLIGAYVCVDADLTRTISGWAGCPEA